MPVVVMHCVEQMLMAVLDSPLNKAGKVTVSCCALVIVLSSSTIWLINRY